MAPPIQGDPLVVRNPAMLDNMLDGGKAGGIPDRVTRNIGSNSKTRLRQGLATRNWPAHLCAVQYTDNSLEK